MNKATPAQIARMRHLDREAASQSEALSNLSAEKLPVLPGYAPTFWEADGFPERVTWSEVAKQTAWLWMTVTQQAHQFGLNIQPSKLARQRASMLGRRLQHLADLADKVAEMATEEDK